MRAKIDGKIVEFQTLEILPETDGVKAEPLPPTGLQPVQIFQFTSGRQGQLERRHVIQAYVAGITLPDFETGAATGPLMSRVVFWTSFRGAAYTAHYNRKVGRWEIRLPSREELNLELRHAPEISEALVWLKQETDFQQTAIREEEVEEVEEDGEKTGKDALEDE